VNLINELSSWESELQSLRSEVKILRESKIVSDFEIDQLRRRNAQLEEKVEYHLTRHVRLKTQLDRTGADLVAAISSFNDDAPHLVSEEPRMLEQAAE
jgi:predicted  nucleic acid-binding Zn-ribbon protein